MAKMPGRIYLKWRGKKYLLGETDEPGTITLKAKKCPEVDAAWILHRYEKNLVKNPDGTATLSLKNRTS